jgi:antirestriction protein ArdC
MQKEEKPVSKVEEHRKAFIEDILTLVQQGKMFWQRPWDVTNIMPVNAVTGKAYQGCNIAYLLFMGMKKQYDDPRWLTYKQAQEKGWQVRKGEKGTKIEFWSVVKNDDKPADDESDDVLRLYCKIYTVFNAAQVEGILPLEEKERNKKTFAFHDRSERIMNGCGVPIRYGGGSAYYNVMEDSIGLPVRERFKDEAHFYATALHEIAHSTGHPSRLDRKLGFDRRSSDYAREELRAEMASAFLQMELGFPLTEEGMKEHTEQHAAYIQSWMSSLKTDYKEFYRATQDATKIADYVLAYDKERTQNREPERNAEPQTAACACGVLRQEFVLRKTEKIPMEGHLHERWGR